MKHLTLLLLALLTAITITAQSDTTQCGTDAMIIRNPLLIERMNSRMNCAPEVDLDTAQILTIPVVVHVLHLGEAIGEGTNISDEQVLSCIDNLNHRYRGDVAALAQLTDQYDEEELALVIDSKIEFCLASRDPDDNATTGIDRHDCSALTYTNEFSGQTSTAYYADKGISNGGIYDIPLLGIPDAIVKDMFHWPVDKYFNMYVVSEINDNNAGNGVQGYSYVGSLGTSANGESYGPVCLYNVTGTTGTLKPLRELNSTWTHEIGHALDLYHTFGVFGGNCEPEVNACTQGDQCPDTPPTGENQSCSPAFATCPDAMLENYMDYTTEACKTAFTQNQIERMRNEIYTGLYYLIDNNFSCISPNSKDLAITYVTLPVSWCIDTLSFTVKVNNLGNEDAEGAILYINNDPIPLPIIPATDAIIVPIEGYPLGTGQFDIEVSWAEDENFDNNLIYEAVTVEDQNWIEVNFSTDYFANEVEWSITDESGNVILGEDDYPLGDSTYTYLTCLPEGCYTFKVTDSAGDGMCTFDLENDGICDYWYNAGFDIVVNGQTIFALYSPEDIDYGSELTYEFCSYLCPVSDCPADFDQDGVVSLHDLLTFLPWHGTIIDECSPYDFNNDLQIDINDVMIFLNWYGATCYDNGLILDSTTDVTEYDPTQVRQLLGVPQYFDMTGRQVDPGNLSQGIYIVVEYWSDGAVEVKKVFRFN